MKQMVNLNFRWFMQTLLDRKDRMSMYHSLEVRVPFCDYRIAEYLYGVPWEFKDYQGQEKGLLRRAVEGLLPEHLRSGAAFRRRRGETRERRPSFRNAEPDAFRADRRGKPVRRNTVDRAEGVRPDSIFSLPVGFPFRRMLWGTDGVVFAAWEAAAGPVSVPFGGRSCRTA